MAKALLFITDPSLLKGIDIAKKHPLPLRPDGDPSVRGIIFNSAYRDMEFGNMKTYSFINMQDDLSCDTSFEEQSWASKDEYNVGTTKYSMVDWEVSYEGRVIKFVELSVVLSVVSNTKCDTQFNTKQHHIF